MTKKTLRRGKTSDFTVVKVKRRTITKKEIDANYGEPCIKCGMRLRAIEGRDCINCMKPEENNISVIIKTKTSNRYIGDACQICGNTERYLSNNNCVACQQKYNRAYKRTAQPTNEDLTTAPSKQFTTDYVESEVVRVAKQILMNAGAGHMKHGAYFLNHRIVGIRQFLDAANEIIRKGEARDSSGPVTEMLGCKHDRWGV